MTQSNQQGEYYLMQNLPGFDKGAIFKKSHTATSFTWLVKNRKAFAHVDSWDGTNQMLNKAVKYMFLMPGSNQKEAIELFKQSILNKVKE